MPSWSARILSNPLSPSSSSAPHSSGVPNPLNTDRRHYLPQSSMSPGSGQSRSRDILNVPSIAGSGSGPPRDQPRRFHSRSNSHPFPSLFGGSKKDNKAAARLDELESTDDEATNYTGLPMDHSPSKSPHRRRGTPSEDLVTGKCMTCDSMVRWPRNLKVFRCSVCVTINDLEPNLDELKDASSKSKGSSGQQVHRKRKNPLTQISCTLLNLS